MQVRNVSFTGNYIKKIDPQAFKQTGSSALGTADNQKFIEDCLVWRADELPPDTDLVLSMTKPEQWDIQLHQNDEPIGKKLSANFHDWFNVYKNAEKIVKNKFGEGVWNSKQPPFKTRNVSDYASDIDK